MRLARFWNHQNVKKFGPVLVKFQTLYTKRCIWDYTNTWRKNPSRFVRCYMTYLEYEGIWSAMLFREHVLSDVLPHLHNNNDNAHKLSFTSSQNSTFSLTFIYKDSSIMYFMITTGQYHYLLCLRITGLLSSLLAIFLWKCHGVVSWPCGPLASRNNSPPPSNLSFNQYLR